MYRSIRSIGQQDIIWDTEPEPPKDYCELPSGACLTDDAKQYLDSLSCSSQVVKGYRTRGGIQGLGKICSIYSIYGGGLTTQITRDLLKSGDYDVCAVKRANVPSCTSSIARPRPPTNDVVQTFAEPTPELPEVPVDEVPEEEPEEDNSSMYAIGGILAVLVVGGIGYAVFKNRKKKGKKK